MSLYLKAVNNIIVQYPYYLSELPVEYPNTSFPVNMTPEFLVAYNIYPVQTTPQPPYNALTQKVEEGTPELIDGVWVQQWVVVELTPEEQAEALQVARYKAWLTAANFRIGLYNMGELERVDEYIAQPTTSEDVKIMYNYATVFERMNPTLIQIATDLGFTDAQLDQLFEVGQPKV